MDTTTHKQEALKLLALDELTREQEINLNILTAKQAGYQVVEGGWGRNLSGDEWRWGYLVSRTGERVTPEYEEKHYKAEDVWLMEAPEFCISVDACLLLPLPDGYFWLMESKFGRDPYGAILYKAFEQQDTQSKYQSDVSLPIAMLKAYWHMQP